MTLELGNLDYDLKNVISGIFQFKRKVRNPYFLGFVSKIRKIWKTFSRFRNARNHRIEKPHLGSFQHFSYRGQTFRHFEHMFVAALGYAEKDS